MSTPKVSLMEELGGVRNKQEDRLFCSMFREEGRGCQVWLSSQSRQHFSPFSWSWEIHIIVRLRSRSPGPGLTPGRNNSAAVWYMASVHTRCLCSCCDNHILATWPLDLGQACLFFPQQACRPGVNLIPLMYFLSYMPACLALILGDPGTPSLRVELVAAECWQGV